MTDSFEHDDELRARLSAADPASSLPPVTPDGAARLLEETMSNDTLTESRDTGSRGRGPLTWLVAAAAVVVIAGVGIFAVLDDGDDGQVPSADRPSETGGAESTVTELTAPDPGAAPRCMIPDAQALAPLPTAFDGTVQSIEGDIVTLVPTQWYAGEPTDLVTVEAPSEALRQLLVAVEFEDGGRYLVAATDGGEVAVCGFSAPYSQGLAATYAEAFGG